MAPPAPARGGPALPLLIALGVPLVAGVAWLFLSRATVAEETRAARDRDPPASVERSKKPAPSAPAPPVQPPPPVEPAPSAGDVPEAAATTCQPGAPCTCTGGSKCERTCAGQACMMRCEAGSRCTFRCPAGKCLAFNDGGGSAELYCQGGGCKLACRDGSCTLFECPNCQFACPPKGARCEKC
jgi:hypothetical protein